jgi:hypothetical protein
MLFVGTFNAQKVANAVWAACVFSVFRAPGEEDRLVHATVQRLVSLETTACFNAADLCQVHQFFVWCRVETRLGVEAIHDMLSLKETRGLAFEGAQTNPSVSQQQVSKTLRDTQVSTDGGGVGQGECRGQICSVFLKIRG